MRLILCEALSLLTTTRFGREYLRKKQVYRVIQRLHAQETDNAVKEKCESIVEMLIRDEAPATDEDKAKGEEPDEDEDMVIEEIV